MLAVLATLQKQAFCCDLDWVIIIMYHYYYCQQFGMFSKMVILQMRLATTTGVRDDSTSAFSTLHFQPGLFNFYIFNVLQPQLLNFQLFTKST